MSDAVRNSSNHTEVANKSDAAEALVPNLGRHSFSAVNGKEIEQKSLSGAQTFLAEKIDGKNPLTIVSNNEQNMSLLHDFDSAVQEHYETPAQIASYERASLPAATTSQQQFAPSPITNPQQLDSFHIVQRGAAPAQPGTSLAQVEQSRAVSPQDEQRRQQELIRELQRDYNKPADKSTTSDEASAGDKTKNKLPLRMEGNSAKDAEAAKQKAKELGVPLVVHFGATWCGPCQTMDKTVYPKMESASSNTKAIFMHVDVDRADKQGIARSLGGRLGSGIPQIMIFKPDGQRTYNQTGGLSYGQLQRLINAAK